MRTLLLLALLTLTAAAQQTPVAVEDEPLHKMVFKNDFVEVMHVVIPPGQSTLFHTHSHDGVALRLSKSRLTVDEPGKPTSAPAKTRIGDVTAQAYGENPYTHRVNNVGKTPFEVIDVEVLKRPEGRTVEPLAELTAENPSSRVYRWQLAAGASSPQHTHERPYLIMAVHDMNLRMTSPDGGAMEHPVKAGEFHWVDSKVTHTLTNEGKQDGSIVEIEIK